MAAMAGAGIAGAAGAEAGAEVLGDGLSGTEGMAGDGAGVECMDIDPSNVVDGSVYGGAAQETLEPPPNCR